MLPERPLTKKEHNKLSPTAGTSVSKSQWSDFGLPRIEWLERKAQPPLGSTTTEYNDEIVVIEYDPLKDRGLKGITKIPRRLTNGQDLESLGWYNYELRVSTSPASSDFSQTV